MAAWLSDPDMVQLLLDRGADRTIKADHHGTALRVAARCGDHILFICSSIRGLMLTAVVGGVGASWPPWFSIVPERRLNFSTLVPTSTSAVGITDPP